MLLNANRSHSRHQFGLVLSQWSEVALLSGGGACH